jgi:hypothetical protein
VAVAVVTVEASVEAAAVVAEVEVAAAGTVASGTAARGPQVDLHAMNREDHREIHRQ